MLIGLCSYKNVLAIWGHSRWKLTLTQIVSLRAFPLFWSPFWILSSGLPLYISSQTSVPGSPFPVPRSPFPVPRSSFYVPRSPFPVPRSPFPVLVTSQSIAMLSRASSFVSVCLCFISQCVRKGYLMIFNLIISVLDFLSSKPPLNSKGRTRVGNLHGVRHLGSFR